MYWNAKERADPIKRLKRLLIHGKRWCAIYWNENFKYENLQVNVALIPLYLIQQIEREELTVEDVTRVMTKSSTNYRLYLALWEEAINYTLGVRQDILRANAAAEFAVQLANKSQWLNAFRAATIALDIEIEHSGEGKYWYPLVNCLSDVLIGLGHARNYYDLRSIAKTPSRNTRTRHSR